MKASLRSVRIAPKKAALVAKMIRGKSVPDAVHTLEHTNKKAARILEQLLRSAMANTSHNVNQDPQMMVIKSLTVNKAQAYHRGVPMARGRVRPMRKFLSHINLTLGFADDKEIKKEEKDASQQKEKPVQKEAAKKSRPTSAKATVGTASTSGKSAKKETAPKTSKSATSKKTPSKSSTSSK